MTLRIVLAIVVLVAVHGAAGAAATLSAALLMLIIVNFRGMVWHAVRRNSAEALEFQLVNTGQKEPRHDFLEQVWRA